MNTCESCRRVQIGEPFQKVSTPRAFVGTFFIYLPILLMPVIIMTALLVYIHLRMMGALDIKPLTDFLPAWKSHRYRYKSQIVYGAASKVAFWQRTRVFWFFNCTLYCPFSVGFLEWTAYLVKLVENWWCPFAHGTKHAYADAPIDYSYWHIAQPVKDLHPDDRNNPVWNQDVAPSSDEPEHTVEASARRVKDAPLTVE